MNGFIFSYARNIPIERFHNTKVIFGLKGSPEIIVGTAKIETEEQTISVYSDNGSWHASFDEVALLRWPPSGLVHDYWGELDGEMIKVPTFSRG